MEKMQTAEEDCAMCNYYRKVAIDHIEKKHPKQLGALIGDFIKLEKIRNDE
jgi:hypothetical protein